MPTPQKQDPEKWCDYCGSRLERKRINGRLEDRSVFLRRRFCNLTCTGLAHTNPNPTTRTWYSRNQRLSRKPVCERCGTSRLLGTHHLDGDPSNNSPSNRMTLCASCHTAWHWQHGKQATPRTNVGPCSVCGAPVSTAGLCSRHYQRLRRYGDPLLTKKRRGYGGPYSLVRLSPPDVR
jgi:hypothetical protein